MRKIGGFSHLLEALEFAANEQNQNLAWFDGFGRLQHQRSYGDILNESQHFACQLLSQLPAHEPDSASNALGPRIGIIATTGPEFLPVLCACQRIGAIPCPLPVLSPLQDPARYCQILQNMCQAAGIDSIIGPKQLLSLLDTWNAEAAATLQKLAFEDLHARSRDSGPVTNSRLDRTIQAADIAYVQFSSGSTGSPKGIAISHAALMHNVDAILQHGMGLQANDRAFSWLPYYHDMGLVGFVLAPLCGQVSVDYLAPTSFARRPHVWLDLMAKRGSTISYAPNFAWALAAKSASHLPEDSCLSALRIAGVGGDYVDYAALEKFAQCFAKNGFNPDAFKPSYGLAEATLAVTFCQAPFQQQQSSFIIDDDTGEVQRTEPTALGAKTMVSCGNPLPGWSVLISNNQGLPLPTMTEGHIGLKGPAQMSGYFRQGQLHPIAQSQSIETGDKGFLTAEGALFVSGRSKDLLVIHGRNTWPNDIENAVYEKTGLAVAHQIFLQVKPIDSQRSEWQLLVHEKAMAKLDKSMALKSIAAAATAAAGASVEVQLIPNGTIAFTSSGKKARALTQARMQAAMNAGQLAPVSH